ncbi:MAG: helix-turn-helix transcriptional regulator [Actinomycetes bacterium]
MEQRRRRQVVAEVERLCRGVQDATALQRAVADVLAAAIPFDRWCALSLDPVTGLPTGGFHAEGLPMPTMPRLLELEYGDEPDVGRLSDVARADDPVVVLSQLTGPDPMRSPRFRDVLQPSGLPHEVRTVHRDGRAPWGAMVLLRGAGGRDFGADEVDVLRAVGPRIARALRLARLRTAATSADSDAAPGVLVLTVSGSRVVVESGTSSARRRLLEIDDGAVDGVPMVVASLARSALARDGVSRCQLRSRTGRWLTLHAERLSAGTVGVVVEPSQPADVAALLSDAYGLTSRETEVVGLVARGHTNAEIAQLLWVSPWTVGDHLKSVFEKTGVRSRGELTSRLFFDHYLPRHSG